MKKRWIDVGAAVCLLVAIVSGFMLHADVHHRHVYDDTLLWGTHEAAGLAMMAAVAIHCFQHKFWFRNYRRIKVSKKRVTTALLALLVIVFITGTILLCGSQSKEASLIHYGTAIIATLVAIGHVAKRWKIFRALK